MPRIDPQQLLSCLGVLLNSNGGIRSKDEVVRLASLMTKYSKNLVSKCVYILILKNTDTELLGRFMSAGGWNLTHVWLTNGIMNKNWALVGELLELMLMCPVDVERLKANNCPKLVKGLSKEGGPEGVRVLASKLVEQWLKVVKGETQGNCMLNNASTYSSTNNNNSSIQISQNSSSINITSSSSSSSTENQENQHDRVIDDVVVEASSYETVSSQESIIVDNNNTTVETSSSSSLHTNETVDQNVEVESTTPPVYRLTFRDGKQVIAKVEESTASSSSSLSSDVPSTVDAKVEKEKDKTNSNSNNSSSSSSKDKDRSKHLSNKHSSSKSSSSSSSSSRRSSSSSSSHRDKSRDKDRDRDRDKRDKERSKHKVNGTSSSSSSSKSSSSSSKESKEKQAEKDKATLAKLQPLSLSKLGKIPKKTSDDDKKDKKSIVAEPPPPKVEVKKPSISIENRKHNSESRPKTVKVFNAKMRSTGLEEEVKPPPPRPLQRKIPPPKRTSPPRDLTKDSSLSHPPEKRPKIVDMVNGELERPGGIKLIAPKPKPVGLQECALFMDAMVAASTKKEPKKRKRRMSVTKEDSAPGGKTNSPPNSPITHTTSKSEKVAVTPAQLQPTAPKFYKDTLEENEESEVKTESNEEQKSSESSSVIKTENVDVKEKDVSVKSETQKTVDASVSSPDIKITEELDVNKLKDEFKIPGGVLVYHKRTGPKKSVKWKEDSSLEEIQYFELDETERVNVTKTFTDMKQIEMCGEREALQMSRKLPNEDLMDERTRWRPLIPIDLSPDLAVLGKKSKEKDIQYAREKVILQALYFHKSMIPDSPTEADAEHHHQMEDPIIIPLDDVAGNPDNIKDFTATPWPESKGELPRVQAPPPVAPFPPIQPNFIPVGGPNTFPPFSNQTNFMGDPPILTGDWRTGDGRVMGIPNEMGPIPPPPNMFGPPIGGMPPPNMFHGPGPDGFNMLPNMNNMNGPFPPGPPVNFPGGPGMFNDGGGFQGNRGGGGGGGNMRGRGRGGFDRYNGPPNNWKGGGGGGHKNFMNRGICKHFQKGGYCRQGDKCQFLHPGVNCPPF